MVGRQGLLSWHYDNTNFVVHNIRINHMWLNINTNLYFLFIYRGVDIQETDTQGRDLEHYARDSWRMSEQVRNFEQFHIVLSYTKISNKNMLASCYKIIIPETIGQ